MFVLVFFLAKHLSTNQATAQSNKDNMMALNLNCSYAVSECEQSIGFGILHRGIDIRLINAGG